jgi:hypothetical protein
MKKYKGYWFAGIYGNVDAIESNNFHKLRSDLRWIARNNTCENGRAHYSILRSREDELVPYECGRFISGKWIVKRGLV